MSCIVRMRTTGFPTFVLHCTDTAFILLGENPGVYNTKRFLCKFRQKLIDRYLQEWHSGVVSRDRLVFYSSFKQSFPCRIVVYHKESCFNTKTLNTFRLGVTPLKGRRLRYSGQTVEHFDCPFCYNTYESDIHFLVVCPK